MHVVLLGKRDHPSGHSEHQLGSGFIFIKCSTIPRWERETFCFFPPLFFPSPCFFFSYWNKCVRFDPLSKTIHRRKTGTVKCGLLFLLASLFFSPIVGPPIFARSITSSDSPKRFDAAAAASVYKIEKRARCFKGEPYYLFLFFLNITYLRRRNVLVLLFNKKKQNLLYTFINASLTTKGRNKSMAFW